jgi:hypothetical protein
MNLSGLLLISENNKISIELQNSHGELAIKQRNSLRYIDKQLIESRLRSQDLINKIDESISSIKTESRKISSRVDNQVNQSRENIATLKKALIESEHELNRYKSLFESGVISVESLNTKKQALKDRTSLLNQQIEARSRLLAKYSKILVDSQNAVKKFEEKFIPQQRSIKKEQSDLERKLIRYQQAIIDKNVTAEQKKLYDRASVNDKRIFEINYYIKKLILANEKKIFEANNLLDKK